MKKLFGTDGMRAVAGEYPLDRPTIYILDHEGVIRHRDLRDKELEEAVVKLLEKVPQK